MDPSAGQEGALATGGDDNSSGSQNAQTVQNNTLPQQEHTQEGNVTNQEGIINTVSEQYAEVYNTTVYPKPLFVTHHIVTPSTSTADNSQLMTMEQWRELFLQDDKATFGFIQSIRGALISIANDCARLENTKS